MSKPGGTQVWEGRVAFYCLRKQQGRGESSLLLQTVLSLKKKKKIIRGNYFLSRRVCLLETGYPKVGVRRAPGGWARGQETQPWSLVTLGNDSVKSPACDPIVWVGV